MPIAFAVGIRIPETSASPHSIRANINACSLSRNRFPPPGFRGSGCSSVPKVASTSVFPQIPGDLSHASHDTIMKLLLNNLMTEQRISDFLLWYYTPMALSFSTHLQPRLTVFDCMDELSAFKDAPQEMKDREAELLSRADLVFTGGQSLYEAKLGRHDDLHVFPSSIEFAHFAQARTHSVEAC